MNYSIILKKLNLVGVFYRCDIKDTEKIVLEAAQDLIRLAGIKL